jgi:quaternary ammonium compound-resistance protein SugE
VLGVSRGAAYRIGHAEVPRGGALLLYTDGVTECPSPSGEEFGVERLSGKPSERMRDLGRWLLLGVSALFEVAWIASLKLMNGFGRFLPLAGYVVSGLGAAVFLSMAMKTIPMGTAYAVWVGGSLVGALVLDAAVFGESWTALRLGSALLILIGTCGLRLAAAR